VDAIATGAAQLLGGLYDAAARFRTFGYEQYLAHQEIDPAREGVVWKRLLIVGGASATAADLSAGVVFGLRDDGNREVCVSVTVALRDDAFVVSGEATVDDPAPDPSANQIELLDLPEIRTQRLDECLDALRDYTTRLCAYTSVLDDLGVHRST
jgi:hypothetical protein